MAKKKIKEVVLSEPTNSDLKELGIKIANPIIKE